MRLVGVMDRVWLVHDYRYLDFNTVAHFGTKVFMTEEDAVMWAGANTYYCKAMDEFQVDPDLVNTDYYKVVPAYIDFIGE